MGLATFEETDPLSTILATIPFGAAANQSKEQNKRREMISNMLQAFSTCPTDDEGLRSTAMLPYVDVFYLRAAHSIIVRELIGVREAGTLQRLSSKTPVAQ